MSSIKEMNLYDSVHLFILEINNFYFLNFLPPPSYWVYHDEHSYTILNKIQHFLFSEFSDLIILNFNFNYMGERVFHGMVKVQKIEFIKFQSTENEEG